MRIVKIPFEKCKYLGWLPEVYITLIYVSDIDTYSSAHFQLDASNTHRNLTHIYIYIIYIIYIYYIYYILYIYIYIIYIYRERRDRETQRGTERAGADLGYFLNEAFQT